MGKKKNQQSFTYSKGKGLLIRLKGKMISGGRISLFLEYYQGYSKSEDGKISLNRKKEVLKLYVSQNPKTPFESNDNKEVFALAQDIRAKRESDLKHNSEGFISPNKKKTNLYDYCQAYIKQYDKSDIRMIKASVKLFFDHVGSNYLLPYQVDEKVIVSFKNSLLKKYNGETPRSYYSRFKKILKAATKEGLFNVNPANDISCEAPEGLNKDILMPDEIMRLANAECGNSELKRAFLLCLNTGLRFVDVESLQYSHIKDGQIEKQQSKTGKKVIIYLNENAITLIGKHSNPEDKVFTLPSFSSCLRTLRNWVARAKIEKHITWHSARHSFGTILMMNNTDIITVKNLLGHTKLEHTQKYTHVVDRLKEEAVKNLPKL